MKKRDRRKFDTANFSFLGFCFGLIFVCLGCGVFFGGGQGSYFENTWSFVCWNNPGDLLQSFTGHLSFCLKIWECDPHLIKEKIVNVSQAMLASYFSILKKNPNQSKNTTKTPPTPQNKHERFLAIISVKSDLWHQTPSGWWLNIFHLKLWEAADFRRQAECGNRWNKSGSEVFGCRCVTRACFVGRNNGVTKLLSHERLLICVSFFFSPK